jgi:hypothetical protein
MEFQLTFCDGSVLHATIPDHFDSDMIVDILSHMVEYHAFEYPLLETISFPFEYSQQDEMAVAVDDTFVYKRQMRPMYRFCQEHVTHVHEQLNMFVYAPNGEFYENVYELIEAKRDEI